jgi:hypothetical protein
MRGLSLDADEPVSGGSALFSLVDFFQPKQRRTAKEQRTPPLFLRSPYRRRPRISAEKEMSIADNLPQEQEKNSERCLTTERLVSGCASDFKRPCVGVHADD